MFTQWPSDRHPGQTTAFREHTITQGTDSRSTPQLCNDRNEHGTRWEHFGGQKAGSRGWPRKTSSGSLELHAGSWLGLSQVENYWQDWLPVLNLKVQEEGRDRRDRGGGTRLGRDVLGEMVTCVGWLEGWGLSLWPCRAVVSWTKVM